MKFEAGVEQNSPGDRLILTGIKNGKTGVDRVGE